MKIYICFWSNGFIDGIMCIKERFEDEEMRKLGLSSPKRQQEKKEE